MLVFLFPQGVNLHNNSTMEGSSDSMPNSMVNFGSLAGPGMPDGGLGGVCTGGYPLAKLTPKQKMVLEVMYGCCPLIFFPT